jgi:predicted nucleic acid-binding protein
MNAVFLDTVGLLALWDRGDQWHSAAEDAFARIVAQRLPFLTTTFVLLECGNAASRRPYRSKVADLRRTLEERNEVVIPTEEDWSQAWDAYGREDPSQPGIVDHVSFVVMRRLGITQAFTNDWHFQTAGFTVLF